MMTEHKDGQDHHERRRASLLGALRGNFLTGLIVVAPVFLTGYLIWTTIGFIDSWVLPWVPARYQPDQLLGIDFRGYGVGIFLIFTVIVGWIAKGLFGRSLLRLGENLVDRMPVVRSIYGGVKQIVETILSQSSSSFDRACLVEYPRRGIWAIAFVATSAKGEVAEKLNNGERMLSVFLPTTPNPTSGFLLFVPADDVFMLDMSVEEAAKLVISAGLVTPPRRDKPAEAPAPEPPATENGQA